MVEAPPPDVEVGGWPRVQVADRRDEPPGSGLLSETLATALHHAGGPAVCVLNRRGRFRLLVCASCRHLLRWDRSDERPLVCPECGATKLRVLRVGRRAGARGARGARTGRPVVEVDTAIAEVPDADIVVGTEAVLHRAAVRRRRPALVAYLDLDQELLAPRYRAAAQAQWLLTRGAQLLSGRPRRETLLLVQTRIPDHVVVQALVRGEPAAVAEAEVEYRRTLAYPPFGALAELAGTDDALAAAIDASARARTCRCSDPPTGAPWYTLPTGTRSRTRWPAASRPAGRSDACARSWTRLGSERRGRARRYDAAVATHTIRLFGDPVLKRPTSEVTDIDGGLVKLVDAMYETMHEAHGVGLAAPQVGVQKRFFVYELPDEGEPHVALQSRRSSRRRASGTTRRAACRCPDWHSTSSARSSSR